MRSPDLRVDSPQQLVLVVGLTGVGKSTVLERIQASLPTVRLLPNRREITDQIIVPDVQRHEGLPVGPVADRIERFRITAAYRARHPGGMAHALSRWLAEHPRVTARADRELLVFDNLRGLGEVQAARDAFVDASFLVLDASPLTRLARLVGRRDPFDRVATPTTEAAGTRAASAARNLTEELQRIEGIAEAFDPAEIAALAVRYGLDAEDLIRAVRIIVEEQTHYDSGAARDDLEAHLPPERRLVIDTDELGTALVTERALAWLDAHVRRDR